MAGDGSRGSKSGDAAITVRLPHKLIKRIGRWGGRPGVSLSRSAAIRRLLEIGLEHVALHSIVGTSKKGVEQAAGLASRMIDYLGDQSATHENREKRKKRLLKGPSEFREMREKHDRMTEKRRSGK